MYQASNTITWHSVDTELPDQSEAWVIVAGKLKYSKDLPDIQFASLVPTNSISWVLERYTTSNSVISYELYWSYVPFPNLNSPSVDVLLDQIEQLKAENKKQAEFIEYTRRFWQG